MSVKEEELAARLLHEYKINMNIYTANEVENLRNMQFGKTWSYNCLGKNNYISK